MIKLTDIWIAVPVDELPEKEGWYTLVCDNAIEISRWYDSENGWDLAEEASVYNKYLRRAKTLAELLQVEGMEDILKEIFQKGYNRACHEERGGGGHVYSFETTYNNLLNK
jgi:hypothetical protein